MNPFKMCLGQLNLESARNLASLEAQMIFAVLMLGSLWYENQDSPSAWTQQNCFAESSARLQAALGDSTFNRDVYRFLSSQSNRVSQGR